MKKMTRDKVLGIVRELHGYLDEIYGDRLGGVYLYGSYARDDARDDSDIDVAVVLKGRVNRWEERELTGDVVSDLSIREGCLILTMFLSEEDFKKRPFDFHRNLAAEGIPV